MSKRMVFIITFLLFGTAMILILSMVTGKKYNRSYLMDAWFIWGLMVVLLPVLGCTGERPMNNLEKGAFLIIGTIVLTIIYYQNGFFDTNFQKQYYQAINTDVTECQHCHRSFEGMEYIKDICPFCGKKIETKVGEIPSKSN